MTKNRFRRRNSHVSNTMRIKFGDIATYKTRPGFRRISHVSNSIRFGRSLDDVILTHVKLKR